MPTLLLLLVVLQRVRLVLTPVLLCHVQPWLLHQARWPL